jgi:hypothetical protein
VRGPQGEAGAEGKEGRRGIEGAPGRIEPIEQVSGRPVSMAPGEHRDEGLEARCPEGDFEIGGGFNAEEAHVHVYASELAGDWGWDVSAINESTTNSAIVTVYAECAKW